MPQEITNTEIIELLKTSAIELEAINEETAKIDQKLDALNQENLIIDEKVRVLNAKNRIIFDFMNKEYGWGKWQNIDAKTFTFIPYEEFSPSWYIMANPSIREKIEVPDDVVVHEVNNLETTETPEHLWVLGEEKSEATTDTCDITTNQDATNEN